MFINPTSLAKDNALAQFTTDSLSFNSDIGMVAETWFKKSRHWEATLDISMVTHSSEKTEKGEEEEVYVPILKHRLLRHSTTHLAGNKKNNSNSSGFVVNQPPVIQSFFFIALYITHQIQFTNPTIS